MYKRQQLVGSLVFQAFHLVLTGFELELQIIQLAQNGVQTLVFRGQMLLCSLNDPLRDAELFADKASVGPVSYTHLDVYKRQSGAASAGSGTYRL